jgi:hypothetical protein
MRDEGEEWNGTAATGDATQTARKQICVAVATFT